MQRYDTSTALIVVDVQNDFADPAGSLSVADGAAIVPAVNGEIAMARSAGSLIVLTQDWHPETTPHFAKDGGVWPVHCLADSWGAELHPALTVPTDAERIRKGVNGEDGYSGFTTRNPTTNETNPTELDTRLCERGVRRVVVVGLATDYCVKATALDASELGFPTTVLSDGVRAVNLSPEDGDQALAELREAGVHIVAGENATSESAARGSDH
jgi:nicotinamidase/pyrazinamidase